MWVLAIAEGVTDCEGMDGKIRVELANLLKDGLIEVDKKALYVTEMGQAFIRNICMAFDKRKRDQASGNKPQFSKAIWFN